MSGITIGPKIFPTQWVVKEKIAFGNMLGFQTKNDDSGLKVSIVREFSHTGRRPAIAGMNA